MPRTDGRNISDLREIKVTTNFIKHAEGSCLIEFGDTKVICTASVEENVPPFLRNSGTGWVTAEYAMIPRSCDTRIRRFPVSGRATEIQRLIGRSLRAVIDMNKLGERTIKIDCDVMQADGGTRTASITGGFIALALAVKKLLDDKVVVENPISDYVAAISVGVFDGETMLDLKYDEDSNAEMDMNVVMVGKGDFVEVQGTAEGKPFSKEKMDELMDLAAKGIKELVGIQKQYLEGFDV